LVNVIKLKFACLGLFCNKYFGIIWLEDIIIITCPNNNNNNNIYLLFGQVDKQDVPITGQPSKRKGKNKNKRNKTIKPPNSHANLLKTEENNAFA
jgi:hypothetical protein